MSASGSRYQRLPRRSMAAKSATTDRKRAMAPAPKAASLVSVSAILTKDETKFDRLIYERVRLGIMSALAVNDELTFNDLKGLFDVTDGNLSAHARKLE